jgi:replicative DNA helicase
MPDQETRPEEKLLAVLLRNPQTAPEVSIRATHVWFQSPILSVAFDVAVEYCCGHEAAPTREILLDLMGRRDPDSAAAHAPALDRLRAVGPVADEAKHVAYYCELLERDWKRRTAQNVMITAADMLDKGQVDEAVEALTRDIVIPLTKFTRSELASDFGAFWADYERIAADPSLRYGVPTGFATIDRATYGHFNKELWVFVGGQGIGKSLMLGQLSVNAAAAKKRVMLVTIENSRETYMRRLYSNICRVPYQDLKTASLRDSDKARLMEGIAGLPEDYCLEVVHMEPPCSTRDILNIMRSAGRTYDYLVVDQITNMSPNHPKDFKVMDWRWYSQVALELRVLGSIVYNGRGIPVATAVHAAGGTVDKKELTADDTALAKSIGYHADGMFFITKKDGEYTLGKSKLRDAFFEPFTVFPNWEHWAISEEPPDSKYGQSVDQAQGGSPAPAPAPSGGPDTSFDIEALEAESFKMGERDLLLATFGDQVPDDFIPTPPASPPPPDPSVGPSSEDL